MKLMAAHVEGLQITTRWHTRALPPQTLADHSCAVALLAALIGGDTVGQEQLGQLFGLALVHDLHETRFGDLAVIPGRAISTADASGECRG